MDRLEYSQEELLTSVTYDEPLVAAGVRCHGGFVGGQYRSPRSVGRGPAIAAWQAQLARRGVPLIEVAPELVPPHYPNAAQAALLLREGVREHNIYRWAGLLLSELERIPETPATPEPAAWEKK